MAKYSFKFKKTHRMEDAAIVVMIFLLAVSLTRGCFYHNHILNHILDHVLAGVFVTANYTYFLIFCKGQNIGTR